MSTHFSIAGKSILITGGTAGIGLSTARHFVEQNANVVISGRRDTGAEIANTMGCHFIQADMTSSSDIENMLSKTSKVLENLDVIINNAGTGGEVSPISGASMETHDTVVATNFRSVFQILQLAPDYMNDGGSIINIASISGLKGGIGQATYSATKASIINLTKTAALELAPRGIRVNAISPGPIMSEIWERRDPSEWSKLIIPLGRIGNPEEIATVCQFMASEAASYVTGANLTVDGGYMSGRSKQVEDLINTTIRN